MLRRRLLTTVLWLTAVALAAALDWPVAEWVHAHGLDVQKTWPSYRRPVNAALKLPGEYSVTLGIALALWALHPLGWRAGGFVALSGVVSAVNALVKWVAGRHRPVTGIAPFDFRPFEGGITGLWTVKNLSFPSGHACLAFATATALAILLPRWHRVFYAAAALVAAERVLENAHYLSDAVVGAELGVLATYATAAALRRFTAPAEVSSPSADEPATAGR